MCHIITTVPLSSYHSRCMYLLIKLHSLIFFSISDFFHCTTRNAGFQRFVQCISFDNFKLLYLIKSYHKKKYFNKELVGNISNMPRIYFQKIRILSTRNTYSLNPTRKCQLYLNQVIKVIRGKQVESSAHFQKD